MLRLTIMSRLQRALMPLRKRSSRGPHPAIVPTLDEGSEAVDVQFDAPHVPDDRLLTAVLHETIEHLDRLPIGGDDDQERTCLHLVRHRNELPRA